LTSVYLTLASGKIMRPSSLVLAAILAALSGCSWLTRQLPPEIFPDERRAAEDLVQSLARRNSELESLRAIAGVNYSSPEGKQSFREVVLVRRPDRLRLETLYPLGVLLIVTATADEMVGFHTREGVFYRGKSSRENLYRYTQIPLSVGEFTSVLMGLPPVAPKGAWKNEGPSIVRDLGGGWKDAITFHASELLPIRWQRFNPEGAVELSAQFAEFANTPAGPFPLKIILEAPTQKRRLEITYQEPEINVDLAPALFVQKKPANAREVALDSVGG
jgi:outer membrane lipoprotein-sorting protein